MGSVRYGLGLLWSGNGLGIGSAVRGLGWAWAGLDTNWACHGLGFACSALGMFSDGHGMEWSWAGSVRTQAEPWLDRPWAGYVLG
jgi:hypothetical protein